MQLIDNKALIDEALQQSAILTGDRFDHGYWLSKVSDVKLVIISKPEVLFDLSIKVFIPLTEGQSPSASYDDGWFNWRFLGSKSALVTIASEILASAMRKQKSHSPTLQAWMMALAAFKRSEQTLAVLEPQSRQDLAGR